MQVHDELLLEVNPSLVKEAASLLQVTMEGAASLLGNSIRLTTCLIFFIYSIFKLKKIQLLQFSFQCLFM